MKFSYLASNNHEIFPKIDFDPEFNVVFAKVENPAVMEQDSHNLGKTFLIKVIDFMLLTSVDNKHPFRKHDVFEGFVFYIELITISKQFITIRRKVASRSKIDISLHETSKKDNFTPYKFTWTHSDLSLPKARDILNEELNLTTLEPYTYRKGLKYFLRSQDDYNDVCSKHQIFA